MKLQRLWQPTHPMFWLMVAFNVLSSVCAWALRAVELPYPVMLFIALVALGNVVGGLWCAWYLLKSEPPGDSVGSKP
ncbi:MAG: hypothetical protein ACKOF9_00675 [Burkholderiales bacterium]